MRFQNRPLSGRTDVRFGSKADICSATADVRFTLNSDRESGFPQKAMSALPPKADMCGATVHVHFVPIADIRPLLKSEMPWRLTRHQCDTDP